MSSTISRIVMPMGTSIRPLRLILPVSENTLVPFEVAVPSAANASAPCRKIHGRQASVSTLLMSVGLPHKPASAGYGGRSRGMPRSPSMDWMSAVSSPHTNAPAPSRTCSVKLNGVPRMLAPRNPRASAAAIAARAWRTAIGYSLRT